MKYDLDKAVEGVAQFNDALVNFSDALKDALINAFEPLLKYGMTSRNRIIYRIRRKRDGKVLTYFNNDEIKRRLDGDN